MKHPSLHTQSFTSYFKTKYFFSSIFIVTDPGPKKNPDPQVSLIVSTMGLPDRITQLQAEEAYTVDEGSDDD